MSHPLLILCFVLETLKLLKKRVICYFHYLKSIPNDDSVKEYITPLVFLDLVYLFQLSIFKIYAIITVYCFNWLP